MSLDSTKVASLNILNNVKTNDVNEVPEDVIVVIVCKTSGNPAPTARLYFVTEKEKTLVYQSTTRQLEYQIPAQCNRIGRYVCEAENNFSKDSKHTDLWIKCPPELCSGQTSRPVYQVPVNQNFSTSLCVLYWPRHPLGSELRRVSADNSFVESRRLDHHVTVVSRDMRQTIVNLTMFSGPDHQLGEVNLTIEYDVGRFSSMYFKLIKPEGSKLGSMTIAAIVCPIVLVLLLIILVLSVMVCRKRETVDDKDIYQSIDEAVGKSSVNNKEIAKRPT
ncbi:uncharacterized protein LOC131949387 isoform X2 [Physella acuta]|uniref:uncharacterized protein LOC131949387 isoform X2 n=1 Tax=Physella acuta TaxID=109671 RepID=UPI0027DE0D57|nr:uncharacterized protein LOC131949387 isoform X2 [Physella acuta]